MKLTALLLAAAMLLSSGNFADDMSAAIEQDRIGEISYAQNGEAVPESVLPFISPTDASVFSHSFDSEENAQNAFRTEMSRELDRLQRSEAGNLWLVPVRLKGDPYFIRWCSVSSVPEDGSPEDVDPKMVVFYKNQPTLLTHQEIEDFLVQENIDAEWTVICSLGYMESNHDHGAYFLYAACDDGDKVIPLSLHPDEDFAFKVYTPLEFAEGYQRGDFHGPVVQEPVPQETSEKPSAPSEPEAPQEPQEPDAPTDDGEEQGIPVPLILGGAVILLGGLMIFLRNKNKKDDF